MHDSQLAILLPANTNQRVISLFDFMDSTYDAKEIREHCECVGRVPLIDPLQKAVPIVHCACQDTQPS